MQHIVKSPSFKITTLVMGMTTLGQAAVALYLPALPMIAAEMAISPTTLKNTITIFLVGFGLSQLIYGPLSDRYGRKRTLLAGIAIFCLGCCLTLIAHTENSLLFSRLIQGLGCGSVLTNGRAILRDCFNGRDLASAASYASMGFAIGFGASPIIGAYLAQYFGWRADFVFLLMAGLALYLILWRCLPETSAQGEKKSSLIVFYQEIFSAYKIIFKNIIFLQLLLGGLFAYVVVVAYNVMTPFLIQNILGYSASFYGWLASLVAIPYYLAASFNRKLVLKFGTSPIFAVGVMLIILAGLMMAASTLFTAIHLAYIIVPMMLATFAQALIFSNTIANALHNFPAEMAGKASALFSSLQIVLTGVFSAGMALLPDTTQLPLALVVLSLGVLSAGVLWRHMKKGN